MNEVDELIRSVLGECLEAVCHEPDGDRCHGVLAMATVGYSDFIAERASGHAEATGHRVSVRTWADE